MASAPEALITPYRDGPLLVRGPVRIVDAQGRELERRRDPIALCRCGKSRLRPLCDGTHKLIGFRAPGAPESACGRRVSDLEQVELEISKQGCLTLRPARQEVRRP
jgi:CDGSH-type Zn-finger protein